MEYRLSKRSLSRLKGVEPILIAIASEGCVNSPFDFGIPNHGGLRTASEQYSLYKKRPRITTKDGYTKKSYHQTGRAFDIYAYVNGEASWDVEYLEPIARHLQKFALEKYNVVLEWGGDWKSFVDAPHFQVKKNQLR